MGDFFRLGKEFGLVLERHQRFHEFYMQESQKQEHVALMNRMNVLDSAGTISPPQWEAIGKKIYFLIENLVFFIAMQCDFFFKSLTLSTGYYVVFVFRLSTASDS